MKTNATYEVHDELAKDLTAMFFELLRKNPQASTDDIMKLVPEQKAPRFYVTFENARRHLSCLKKKVPFYEKKMLIRKSCTLNFIKGGKL